MKRSSSDTLQMIYFSILNKRVKNRYLRQGPWSAWLVSDFCVLSVLKLFLRSLGPGFNLSFRLLCFSQKVVWLRL
jgi:hypothetical protein